LRVFGEKVATNARNMKEIKENGKCIKTYTELRMEGERKMGNMQNEKV
jgi:hypothetical protein